MIKFDLHIHSLASGHATKSTITEIAKTASLNGLSLIGISDHAPKSLHAGKPSYFQNLIHAPKLRFGVRVLYGIELNILDFDGNVDLDYEILNKLDYAIISMHSHNIASGTVLQNTDAYINAIKHPNVKIIGHCDSPAYPVDYPRLLKAAMKNNVIFEINNSSLSPNGYRGDTKKNNTQILELCAKYNYPVVLSSDSHGTAHVGDFTYALRLINEVNFPKDLILNYSLVGLSEFLHKEL